MKMKLHWSPRSPFVRKVMIVLHETNLLDDVELVRSLVAVHLPPNPDVMVDNPLGKIPTLITSDGTTLFDSRVICEYLDMRSGGMLIPADPNARLAQMRWQAMADGLIDILLLWRTELTRETGPWPAVTSGWQIKVRTVLERLESEAGKLGEPRFGLGQIAIICALGQLDFRWNDAAWRDYFPRLAALDAIWNERGSILATRVVDDQRDGDSVTRNQLTFLP